MQNKHEHCLLTLICDPGLRDTLVDWLLGYPLQLVFSSAAIDLYGLDPDSLNAAEQVTGRQQKLAFQIQTTTQTAHDICGSLRLEFPGAHLWYRMSPVLEAGYLGLSPARQLSDAD